MALETDISSNKNLVFSGDFSSLIENGQILLLNEPLMIYTQESNDNDCAIVLDPISDENSQNLNLPEIIFDGNYFQFENVQGNNFQNDFEFHENFHYVDERQQVDDGLAVLEILCNNNNNAPDQPEFVDVSNLTEHDKPKNTKENDVLCISDDDDVVFVGEYKENKTENVEKVVDDNVISKTTDNGIRRNPVRKVRIRSRDLSKEHIFEEDFAFLDTSDEELEKEQEKENKTPPKKATQSNESFKQWPVNVHERPEYNTTTKKIEAFDYTIREIQKKAPNKKPRLETVAVRRKSKKKYYTRKRRPRVAEVKKIPIEELRPLVDSTTELLQVYFANSRESRKLVGPEVRNLEICNVDNCLEVLKNQALLFSIVNDLDQSEVIRRLNVTNLVEENATKV